MRQPVALARAWFTVVGIARDVKQAGLDVKTGTELYYYNPQVAALVKPPGT